MKFLFLFLEASEALKRDLLTNCFVQSTKVELECVSSNKFCLKMYTHRTRGTFLSEIMAFGFHNKYDKIIPSLK